MGCESSQITALEEPHEVPRPIHLSNSEEHVKNRDFPTYANMGDQLFCDGKFVEAINAYQKIIEAGYQVDFDISGVGCADLSISRYEWHMYRWYDESRKSGIIKGNIFDALSLCINQIRNTQQEVIDKAIIWYEDMLGDHQCYQLYIGYANALYNRARYEEAIKMYTKVIKLKPNLINAYASLALLYEYRRIQKSKSVAMAKQILEKDPNNMYAFYILARNEQNVDVKIQKLKEAFGKFPDYLRIANDVGIAYGSKKQHRQAIVWYKKCLEIQPSYAAASNNVGVRTQMLKLYEQALPWYLRACELDHQYKAAHGNAIDIFVQLKYTDDQILQVMKKYTKLDPFMFYYYLGLAYYDKKKVNQSIKWYKRAEAINDKHFDLMNSFGISYDQIKQYKEAEEYYLKCIQLNPKYHMAYYNLGILYKAQGQVEKTIEFYKKAVQVNPRYNKPYNNLGNIYKDRGQFQKAIECYKKAVEVHSTYTLCYANMGLCFLKLERYQDAFAALSRAKQILPTDNNNLSQGNKNFLKENLELFDKEGDKWRKTGSIDPLQKENLKKLIKSFQSNFRQLYSNEASVGVSDQKALKPEILHIVNVIAADQFDLKEVNKIFDLIKHIFHEDEEYFHILPQAFIQYFWKNVFELNLPILEVEAKLSAMVQDISAKESSTNTDESKNSYTLTPKMKYFNPPSNFQVNLFKDTAYFANYEVLYSQIVKVNTLAEQSLADFVEFVEAVRKRSNGIPYGANMKMPKRPDQQFKVILRILEKMFKKEITKDRVKTIIAKIGNALKEGGKEITLGNIVHEIMEVWTQEITIILAERTKNKVDTTCGISDLVRGKIMFNSVEDLGRAVEACDKLCHLHNYEILELDNRLSKPQTMDVVLKIRIGQAVCEFQLAMKQDESKYHLIHSIYEIERSPLGCIFGSYLFMSKGFNYPLLANCKDIEARLKDSAKEEDKKTVESARYIINALELKK